MARSVTFANLKEAIRQRYDLPSFSTTTYITTSTINSLVNTSLQALYALLMVQYGDDYFTTSTTLTTSANIGITSLPTRCIKLVKLWWIRGTDDVVPICRGTVDDLMFLNYSAKAWTEYTPKYRLSGTAAIQWLPAPSSAYSVQCDHVALPSDLSNDADTFEAGPAWEEFVIADVCCKIAQREEKDPSIYLAERAGWEERIRGQSGERNEAEPLRLRDVSGHGMSDYQLRDVLSRWG